MRLKIAIVSDLHCRDSHEGVKTTYLYSDLLKDPISRHPIESIKSKIIEDGLSSDYLFCLGDITDKINQQGLISGWAYLNELAVSLGVNPGHIITVAGNHDIDSRKSHTYSSFNHIIRGLNNVIPINDISLCNQFWTQNYILKEFEDLIILAYNSVYNHTDEIRAKGTDIQQSVLDSIEADLNKLTHTNKPKVAICHHHPIKFSNFELSYKDGDSIENGDKLLDLLSQKNFSIFIHGHKHIPHLEYRNDVPIFCSGSFSSLENIAILSKRNTFHIIEILVEEKTKCRGKIETYEFVLGRGWKKNTDSEGSFPSDSGFGFVGNISSLAQRISDWFINQNKEMIRYSEVLNNFDELNFLTPYQQNQLEDSLMSEEKIKIIPSLRVRPELITKELEP